MPSDLINFQHDPLAVAVALVWDVAAVERLPLRIASEEGWLRMAEGAGGRSTAVVTAVDGERFSELWLDHVARALPAS